MYVGLDAYGSYKVFKNEESMNKHLDDFKYCIFDCSTALKGPIHTLVRTKDIHPLPEKIKWSVTFETIMTDLPFGTENFKTFEYEIHSLSQLYAIVSNCYQYNGYNIFIENLTSDADMTEAGIEVHNIKSINIEYQRNFEGPIQTCNYYYDIMAPTMTEFFKECGVNVHTEKFFAGKKPDCLDTPYLILYNDDSYEVCSEVKFNRSDIRYVGICLYETESMYLVDYETYQNFNLIWSIELQLSTEKYSFHSFEYVSHIASEFVMSVNGSGIYDACLYIPQYISFHLVSCELEEYTDDTYVDIQFEFRGGTTINIKCMPKDVLSGVSLFKIIDKITKI